VSRRRGRNALLSVPPKGVHGLDVAGGRFFEQVVGRPVTREDYYGVHTTDSLAIAATYATGATFEFWSGEHYVRSAPGTDSYPVIISLNTSGLEALPDVDALAQAAEWLDAPWMRNQFEGMSLDEAQDMWEYQSELQVGSDVGASVVEETVQRGVVWAFEDEYAWEVWVERGEYTPEVAIALVQQKRFLTDIGYDRLVGIDAMKPWWPYVLEEPYDETAEQKIERIAAAGYKAVTIEDFFYDQLVDVQEVARGPAPDAYVEYHGTSSISAQAAFPEVSLPPNPFPVQDINLKKLKRRLMR